MTLTQIADRIKTCKKCPLHQTRTNTVPGEGPENAEIMFIGEGPGKNEDEQGRPFVGAAGRLLEELLAGISLTREQVFIGNVVKCRPPNNRDPLPEEVEQCWPYLKEQVKILKPTLIVTLGRHSMNRFLPGKQISKDHGKVFRREWEKGITNFFYPVFHPAAALYRREMMIALKEDFKKIPMVLTKVKNSVDQSISKSEISEKKNTIDNMIITDKETFANHSPANEPKQNSML